MVKAEEMFPCLGDTSDVLLAPYAFGKLLKLEML